MKRLMTALSLAVLLFGGSASVAEAKAPAKAHHHKHYVVKHHDEDVTWTHWGAAPYARSFSEACAKTPKAIAMSSLPPGVKDLLVQKIGSKCEGGTDVYLTPTQHLNQMASASSTGDFMMTDVTVAKLPVAQAPDGLHYRAGSVFETAHAKAWRVNFEGVTYVWFIPDVCYNDGWFTEQPKEDCFGIGFSVPAPSSYPQGWSPTVSWGIAAKDGKPWLPSGCNAQREGSSGPFLAWYGKCFICNEAVDFIAKLFGVREEDVTIVEKYRYDAKDSRQILRFSSQVLHEVVYICVLYPDGSTRTVFVRPQDWKGGNFVSVANRFWFDPAGILRPHGNPY